jgi:hypothetical protein
MVEGASAKSALIGVHVASCFFAKGELHDTIFFFANLASVEFVFAEIQCAALAELGKAGLAHHF